MKKTALIRISTLALTLFCGAAWPDVTSKWLMPWPGEGRKVWYRTPQGSMMVPMDIFLTMKTARGDRVFSDRANLQHYGWVYAPEADGGGYTYHNLPLGFVEEPNHAMNNVMTMGITCAACHTGEIHHNNIRYVVDGAPPLVDLEKFIGDLTRALTATQKSHARMAVLRKAIQQLNPSSPYAADVKRLEGDMLAVTKYFQGREERDKPRVHYGNGRIDAFSEILNEVLVTHVGLKQKDKTGKFVNAEYPASPISIPHMWTAPDLECLQTNCISRNPLSRNLGEVLGVFGAMHMRLFKDGKPNFQDLKNIGDLFDATADLNNLYRLEESMVSLPSPKWPDEFGKLDEDLVKRGREIYTAKAYTAGGEKVACASCHVMADRSNPDSLTEVNSLGHQFYKVTRWSPDITKTDTGFLDQQVSRTVEGLPLGLAAIYDVIVNKDKPIYDRFDTTVKKSAIKFLAVTTTLAVKKFFRDNNFSDQEQAKYVMGHVVATKFEPRVYKARPLNGIAFSSPYLHNGSVASLEQLLTPPAERMASFPLGTLDWDTEKVGYRTDANATYELVRSELDTRIKGNHNSGHEWGTELSAVDKKALLEFLKSL